MRQGGREGGLGVECGGRRKGGRNREIMGAAVGLVVTEAVLGAHAFSAPVAVLSCPNCSACVRACVRACEIDETQRHSEIDGAAWQCAVNLPCVHLVRKGQTF